MMRPTTDCSLQFEESRAAIIVRFQQTLEYNIYMNETCCRASGISCIRFLYVMFWLKRWKGFIKVANINAAFHFWVYIKKSIQTSIKFLISAWTLNYSTSQLHHQIINGHIYEL